MNWTTEQYCYHDHYTGLSPEGFRATIAWADGPAAIGNWYLTLKGRPVAYCRTVDEAKSLAEWMIRSEKDVSEVRA